MTMLIQFGVNKTNMTGLTGWADRRTHPCIGYHPGLSCQHYQVKRSDYMDWQVAPPKRVTSPTHGPLALCEQSLS